MKILIVGQGGREHAMAWKIAQSPLAKTIYIAPGNAGTASEKKCQNVNIATTDVASLLKFSLQENIDLTIIGPEAPLAEGLVDTFQDHGLLCFGPTRAAAQLESSKAFCKNFMQQHGIPTATHSTFTNTTEAIRYLQTQSFPIVIKADGLAAGKGVIIADNLETATTAIVNMLDDHRFGQAGARIIIEEYIEGEELSFIVMTDGKTILPLASSQDHKRLLDNDQGPNTGGMGAYSPAPLCTPDLEERILKEVIRPAIEGMNQNLTPFTGFLYAGLMINSNKNINVLEFNCRLGDPETQPLLMRLESDLLELCKAAAQGELHLHDAKWSPRSAISVVMAANGYPGAVEKGDLITGLNQTRDASCIFHAATAIQNNDIITNGGRVLSVTSLGDDLQTASANAYELVDQIHWNGCHYRKDIGAKALSCKHEPA